MKIKLGGKIFLLVLVGIGAFFLIKHYQSTHPKTPVMAGIDSTKAKIDTPQATLPDSQEAVTGKPDLKTTPSAQPIPPAKITRATADPQSPLPHPSHNNNNNNNKTKKRDGERKNVDLENF